MQMPKMKKKELFLKASFNEHKENLSDAFYVAKDFFKRSAFA